MQLSKIYLRRVQCLTSSSLATVSLHCGIRLTKLDVVGLLKSSRTSRTKSGAEMGATPGMMKSGSLTRTAISVTPTLATISRCSPLSPPTILSAALARFPLSEIRRTTTSRHVKAAVAALDDTAE